MIDLSHLIFHYKNQKPYIISQYAKRLYTNTLIQTCMGTWERPVFYTDLGDNCFIRPTSDIRRKFYTVDCLLKRSPSLNRMIFILENLNKKNVKNVTIISINTEYENNGLAVVVGNNFYLLDFRAADIGEHFSALVQLESTSIVPITSIKAVNRTNKNSTFYIKG